MTTASDATPTLRSNAEGAVYVQRDASAEPVKVTTMPGGESIAAWVPDLGLIVAGTAQSLGSYNRKLWLVPPAGGEPVALTTALDEDAIRLIEANNPELEFDWTRILKGQSDPEVVPVPDRRDRRPRDQSQKQHKACTLAPSHRRTRNTTHDVGPPFPRGASESPCRAPG